MNNKKIFAANWKLNKTPTESGQFVYDFKNQIIFEDHFFHDKGYF